LKALRDQAVVSPVVKASDERLREEQQTGV
jgi:hypothetical protein